MNGALWVAQTMLAAVEEPVAREAVRPPLGPGLLDRRARALEQAAEFDSGRAGGLAGAAPQAVVHGLREGGVVNRHLPAIHGAHEADPAPRVGALQRGQRVGRAGRQAEPALDALGEKVALRAQPVRPARS